MRYILSGIVLFTVLSFGVGSLSCNQLENGTLTQISFSRDTVLFDTVFTQMGSHTEVFLIRNTGSQPVKFDRIFIGGGSNSPYRFNVNGVPGNSNNEVINVELDGNDSLYVFVEVTLDPNNQTQPLIVLDSVVIETGTQSKRNILAAFGQDAHYFYPTDTLAGPGIPYSVIPCNMVWTAEKPYVIVGWAVIDSDCKLTIQPGVRVHFFNNGALWVYKNGTLQVLGERDNPVVFEGTRLEYKYRETPGQWDRILINEGSTNNIIRNAIIKNGFIGLQCDNLDAINGSPGTPNQVILENVQIRNMSGLGIYSNNFNLRAYNLLVNNCGQYSTVFAFGGNIELYHSTIVNYWSRSTRRFPALFMNNFYVRPSDNIVLSQPLNAKFYNSIFYGNADNEVGWDYVTTTALNFTFDHCLLKIDPEVNTSDITRFNQIIKNTDPRFEDTFIQDFRLKENSSAINQGDPGFVINNINQLLFDLKGSNRLWNGKPDLGAFER
ncbi:MAG: hypothetical protein N2167_05310 [Flavobacteriales bacterium]|nr:hypothetical protein [Flavobacteriales bacterium]